MESFEGYLPEHRARLQALLEEPDWAALRAQDGPLAAMRATVREPPGAPSQLSGAAAYLKERNGPRVHALIEQGERDEGVLTAALADWEAALADGGPFPMLFLGLVVTLGCSFHPRCLYCNQRVLPGLMSLDDWKSAIADAAAGPVAPYVYLTGGEPLLLREQVWGDDGLIPFAVECGCAVNVNTNAALITPEAALALVKAGTAKLHISLDSADPVVQGRLFGDPTRVEQVWRGIHNVQVARELLGAQHPQVHLNCVMTRLNLFGFPDLLRAILAVRRPHGDSGELAFHLIPVGGADNSGIRPTAEEWRRFYTDTWAEAEQIWQEHQASVGVPEPDRKTLTAHVPFASPWHRVDHHMDLEEYCRLAAEGTYWQGAVGDRCYLAPSQAFVLPDGSQHWCGAHAIRRPEPIGSALGGSLRANIRAAAGRLADLPIDACASCAGATCVINQRMADDLRGTVREWLQA